MTTPKPDTEKTQCPKCNTIFTVEYQRCPVCNANLSIDTEKWEEIAGEAAKELWSNGLLCNADRAFGTFDIAELQKTASRFFLSAIQKAHKKDLELPGGVEANMRVLQKALGYLRNAEDALAPHSGSEMSSPNPEWPRGVMNCVGLAIRELELLSSPGLSSDAEALPKKTPSGKLFGYCPVCNDPIDDSQETRHTDEGLTHADCCEPEPASESTHGQKYVVGFMFDFAFEQVALIRKNKPSWQAGKLNGIGGKIEPGESRDEAMRREFIEEAGIDAPWNFYCTCAGTNNDGSPFSLDCFWSQGDLRALKSQESEQIEVLTLTQVIARRSEMIGNLPWHLELARDFATGVFPPRIVNAEYGPSVPVATANQPTPPVPESADIWKTPEESETLKSIRGLVIATGITEDEGSTLGMVASICDYAKSKIKSPSSVLPAATEKGGDATCARKQNSVQKSASNAAAKSDPSAAAIVEREKWTEMQESGDAAGHSNWHLIVNGCRESLWVTRNQACKIRDLHTVSLLRLQRSLFSEIKKAIWGEHAPSGYEPNLPIAIRQIVSNLQALTMARERETDHHLAEVEQLRRERDDFENRLRAADDSRDRLIDEVESSRAQLKQVRNALLNARDAFQLCIVCDQGHHADPNRDIAVQLLENWKDEASAALAQLEENKKDSGIKEP